MTVHDKLAAVLPFVVCNSLQALPHPTSVKAGVVGQTVAAFQAMGTFPERRDRLGDDRGSSLKEESV